MAEIQRLMGTLVYADRLADSPYKARCASLPPALLRPCAPPRPPLLVPSLPRRRRLRPHLRASPGSAVRRVRRTSCPRTTGTRRRSA